MPESYRFQHKDGRVRGRWSKKSFRQVAKEVGVWPLPGGWMKSKATDSIRPLKLGMWFAIMSPSSTSYRRSIFPKANGFSNLNGQRHRSAYDSRRAQAARKPLTSSNTCG
jgi:hypothetical protein